MAGYFASEKRVISKHRDSVRNQIDSLESAVRILIQEEIDQPFEIPPG